MDDKKSVPTKEELELIRDFILLPIMLSIVEKNRVEMEMSANPLKTLYITSANALMDRIHGDLVSVKKSLQERKIKVFEEERLDYAIRYRFICRGYEDTFAMMRDLVRSELSVRLGKYVAYIFTGRLY